MIFMFIFKFNSKWFIVPICYSVEKKKLNILKHILLFQKVKDSQKSIFLKFVGKFLSPRFEHSPWLQISVYH